MSETKQAETTPHDDEMDRRKIPIYGGVKGRKKKMNMTKSACIGLGRMSDYETGGLEGSSVNKL